MDYLVSLQQKEMHFGFTHTFSSEERHELLAAKLDEEIRINGGTAHLDKYGDMNFSLRSPGGRRNYCVDYGELCRQLKNPDGVELYARLANK
ncbi:hypothetical protein [Massilia pseudoviolaceinigra]|uniref:hypothetical protein n=1 Tax=Massilia pseudoviolaceinigra TaxID=3057165 RepID=UPI002796B3D0|nr:hypothetical protein [Massilia sp. CCM 9206]MDQ1921642.1 hypothetical protein [Massilia sp. CCM 9206]